MYKYTGLIYQMTQSHAIRLWSLITKYTASSARWSIVISTTTVSVLITFGAMKQIGRRTRSCWRCRSWSCCERSEWALSFRVGMRMRVRLWMTVGNVMIDGRSVMKRWWLSHIPLSVSFA
jgi:hypothetical protein